MQQVITQWKSWIDELTQKGIHNGNVEIREVAKNVNVDLITNIMNL